MNSTFQREIQLINNLANNLDNFIKTIETRTQLLINSLSQRFESVWLNFEINPSTNNIGNLTPVRKVMNNGVSFLSYPINLIHG